jgi:CRISPR/Cas system-associated exonuclease Cas4 (RecB family)
LLQPLDVSVSELSSYEFCPEFHRLKFVQTWDDRVMALWPRPQNNFSKKRIEKTELEKLLSHLGIEKKERGIALHRVLERVQGTIANSSLWREWLKDAYLAQGLEEGEGLRELLDKDLVTLSNFVESTLGRTIFSDYVAAFAEIPFLWSVDGAVIVGAIDRVVQKETNHWIVVDYKSSSLEATAGRYRFQIATYAAALEAALQNSQAGAKVEAWIVDLFTGEAKAVETEQKNKKYLVTGGLANVRANYQKNSRGIVGKQECFSCPYSLHCAAGKEYVLQ